MGESTACGAVSDMEGASEKVPVPGTLCMLPHFLLCIGIGQAFAQVPCPCPSRFNSTCDTHLEA